MDALKQQLLRIQQQLTTLSASQKMLTASLVVIMIMTMFYWSRYAGTAEMGVLLDQPLEPENLAQITAAIEAKGVAYQVQGNRILVPAEKRAELFSVLAFQQQLPANFKSGFDSYLKNRNPFDSQSINDQMLNYAKQGEIGNMIGMWPGVKQAQVIIDPHRKMNPSRSIEPTASINITLKPGETSSLKMANAAANFVAGSQAGLALKNIKVTINGTAMKIKDPTDEASAGLGENDLFDLRVRNEERYEKRVRDMVYYIPNVIATVTVDVQSKSSQISEKVVDPKNKVEAMVSQSTSSQENTQASAAGEPGVNPNTTMSIEGSSTDRGQNSISEKSETKYQAEIGSKTILTKDPAGAVIPIAAAVHVPTTYFARIWKMENKGEPTFQDLEAIMTRETPHIREAARSATGIKDLGMISVARYIDVSEPIVGEAAEASLATLPSGYGFGAKEIAIGALAIISLFMVSMMVRKSVPQPVLAAAGISIPQGVTVDELQPGMLGGNDIAGEVGEGGAMLVGQELSPADMEAKQVIEQVGTMVSKDPDVAATLVKRWLNRD